MEKKILIVEDKKDIADLIIYHLEKENFEVFCALNGLEAFQLLKENSIDLIVLDLMLPKMNGLEVLKTLKADPVQKDIPVIIESAKSEDVDVVRGLGLGAEDYVTKPFSPKVLLARIHKILDRNKKEDKEIIKLFNDHLTIDLQKHLVYVNGQLIHLTSIEFDLLHFLIRNKNKVLSREKILEGVWKEEVIVVDRVIDVHMNSLRKKLGSSACFIKTNRGVGYILMVEEPKI